MKNFNLGHFGRHMGMVTLLTLALGLFGTLASFAAHATSSVADVQAEVIKTFNKLERKLGCSHRIRGGSNCLKSWHNYDFVTSFGETLHNSVVYQVYQDVDINTGIAIVEERGFMVGPFQMDSGEVYGFRMVVERVRPANGGQAYESFHVYAHKVVNGQPEIGGTELVSGSIWTHYLRSELLFAIGRAAYSLQSVRRQIDNL
jgi:hypothetical protein